MSITTKIGKVLKAPLVLLVLASFIASIYAVMNKIAGITSAVPVILGVILGLYVIGMFLDRKGTEAEGASSEYYAASSE